MCYSVPTSASTVCRWAVTADAMMWVGQLSAHGDSMTRQTYSIMGRVMPEYYWLIVFVIIAAISAMLAVMQRKPATPLGRLGVNAFYFLVAVFWWGVAFLMFAASYPLAPGGSGEFVVAGLASFLFVRSAIRGD